MNGEFGIERFKDVAHSTFGDFADDAEAATEHISGSKRRLSR
jgi:hypothetical protein